MEHDNQSTNYKQKFIDSEHKFDTIFELTSAASKIINSDLIILKVNKALTELLGFSAEQIEGTRILDYACEEHKQHWHDLQDALWSRKLPFFKLDACLIRSDKSLAWVNVTTILFEDEGETFGFTVLDDITYRKNFEESEKQLKASLNNAEQIQTKLKENERRLTRILETMAEGIGIIDTDGCITYANPMAQKILGLEQEAILKRTFYDNSWQNLRVDGTVLPPEEHPMNITMKTGQPVYDREIAVQPPDAERFYISINAAPLHDDKGNIVAGIGTFMDVTHRRKLTRQKDEFISVASHELRTPITSLKASLQLLNKMKNNPSEKMLPNLIDQANRSLDKVSILITDLLNASRFNEGQLQLNKIWFTIADLINDCCYHVRVAGEYTIVTEGDFNLSVFADATRIDQVIMNLVNNCMKYAAESKEIKVLIVKVGEEAKVSVIDKGPGILPEKRTHLFERYYRADVGSIQYSGLGLGLYICAEIIKKHGGHIGVESEVGRGSTFWFTLPIQS
ncbi:PAS domain S-box protein [Mucilaginibacter sp. PAMB04168]|uniref:PAS domain S-box protein n=1 Tax=Mucilaginibacter sp. PAMB04168 TaxID=3138567 RepID=UPI0031F6EF8C